MKDKRFRRAKLWLGCFCVICALLVSLPFAAQAKEAKVVRVGISNKDGYHAVDKHGRHSGYDYEYLKKISSYTGWEYEYVEATWDKCLTMLENGEIDLLGSVAKTDEREKRMRFSGIPTINSSNCLLQSINNEKYVYEDYDSFDGMKIGMIKGTTLNDALKEHSREKGFSYTPVMFETAETLRKALESGEIDSVALSSTRDLSRYSVLDYFGYSQRYYVTSLNRPDLAEELENALQQIQVKEPEFEYELYKRHFGYAHNIAFTREELDFIKKSDPIRVGLYMDVGELFCRRESSGRYAGLAVDTLELLSKRTGLRFLYSTIEDGQTPGEYLKENPGAIVAPSLMNSLVSHDSGYLHLDPIIKGRMLTVIKSGESLQLDDSLRLAVPEGLYGEEDRIGEVFPNAKLIPCKTHKDGLSMVESDEADMALSNEMVTIYQMQSPLLDDLQTINLTRITEDMTLGISYEANPYLISILNKGTFSLGERDIRQIVVNNTTSTAYKMTVGEWIYQYRYVLSLLVLLILGIALYISQRYKFQQRKNQDRQRLLLAEERIRAEKEYQKRLFTQANYDELTGLYNHKYFIQKADELLDRTPHKVFTFLRINLRGFKMLNDMYGADAGDAILCRVADQMREQVGGSGIYGRLYADQFAACVPVSREELEQSIWEQSVQIMDYKGQHIRVEVFIGAYVDEQQCRDAAQALEYAQIALRNRSSEEVHVSYFKEDYLEDMRLVQMIINEMDRALREEQFEVYLQPQFNTDGSVIVGAEALVRWINPEYGFLSPAVFIPVFERSKFIYRLDAYVCDKACKILAGWLAQGKAVPISINLSQVDLENPELISMLQETLKRHNVPIEYLHLEITESAYTEDQEHLRKIIGRLRDLGFCVEMDDFGSGYSSLNMLKDISVDVLKLDMKFLGGETHMERGGNIIDAIIKMAHALNIMVIAEGVETEREAKFLETAGCDFVQGYLHGRPEPAGKFTDRLAESAIGKKQIGSGNQEIDDLYWKLEKYEILLKQDQSILLDYDPGADRAILTFMDGQAEQQEVVKDDYSLKAERNEQIHPEYRETLTEAICSGEQEKTEMDFLGAYYEDKIYEWFHAVIYCYKRNDRHSRTVALIRRVDAGSPA